MKSRREFDRVACTECNRKLLIWRYPSFEPFSSNWQPLFAWFDRSI
ncbi:MAG: hypothetical protein ACRC2V_05580 [Xenococcaceae cyanobacterium]